MILKRPMFDAESDDGKIRRLAKDVFDEHHLKTILATVSTEMRQSVYDRIYPHLNFKPRSFRALMRHC